MIFFSNMILIIAQSFSIFISWFSNKCTQLSFFYITYSCLHPVRKISVDVYCAKFHQYYQFCYLWQIFLTILHKGRKGQTITLTKKSWSYLVRQLTTETEPYISYICALNLWYKTFSYNVIRRRESLYSPRKIIPLLMIKIKKEPRICAKVLGSGFILVLKIRRLGWVPVSEW